MKDRELDCVVIGYNEVPFERYESFLRGYGEDTEAYRDLKVFGGLQDQSVTKDELMAWRAQTTPAFNLSMVPGGHLFARESYQLLLRAITNTLTPLLRANSKDYEELAQVV